MEKNKYLSLILILLITFSASAIGGFATSSFKEPWYSELNLPAFNPPSWVFGPVWTLLYFLMSISVWLVLNKTANKNILIIYLVHLFFNSLWSIIFFYFHKIGLALLDLMIIISFIIYLMKIYYKEYTLSFYLMIPYLLWSSYAFVLNVNILILN